MIVQRNETNYTICAQTADENIAVAALVEMMSQLAEAGKLTDDEFNNGFGCKHDRGNNPRNWVTLPIRFIECVETV